MIAEAYFFDKKVPIHLDYATLAEKLPRIRPKRLVLTHMNDDMLSRSDEAPCERRSAAGAGQVRAGWPPRNRGAAQPPEG